MDNRLDIIYILRVLYKRRKFILGVTFLVSILTAIGSLFLPNYYKSSTVFYSASPDVAKPEFIFGTSDNKSLEYFGSSQENDRLFTVANSRDMHTFLIDSFNLRERYAIKSDKPRALERLYERVDEHYKVIKTKYDAIELSFEDKDPEFAAMVANAARERLDNLLVSQIRSKQWAQFNALDRSIRNKINTLEAVSDSLKQVRGQYRIINASAQSEMLATLVTETESRLTRESAKLEALQGSRVKRDTIDFIAANVKGLEKELATLLDAEKGGQGGIAGFNEGRLKVENLEGRFYTARNQISYDKERQKQLKAALEADVSFLHIVEEAGVPLVKHRPKRSIYVITAFLISLIFCTIGVLLQESFRAFDWNAIKHESK